jgi:MFS family permease
MVTTTAAQPASPDNEESNAAPAVAEQGRAGTIESLRLPAFRLLLTGTTLDNAAQWIQQVTLGWLMYDWTGSGAALGALNLTRSIATIGLAPLAGVAIDRFPRKALMYVTNSWLLGISAVLGVSLLTGQGQLWWLFLFTFLGGMVQALDLPLRQTVVFVVVPRALAPNAVALVQTGWALMRSLGPAIGGFLILWFGPAGNFLIQASAYCLIMITITKMQFPRSAAANRPVTAKSGLADGIRYVSKEPGIRAFVLMGWVLPLLIIPNYTALPPIYAKVVYDGGPETLGILLSAVGLGGIAGGLVAASLGGVEYRGRVQLLALFLLGSSLMGFALSDQLYFAVPMLVLSGFFEMIYLTSNQTLLQLSIPDAVRGRVMGIVTLNAGLSPVGAVAAGFGADIFGPQKVTMILSGTAILLSVLVYTFSSTVRDHRMSKAIRTHSAKHA